jgi:hypothetical protein
LHRRLTVAACAACVGVLASAWWRWERGVEPISLDLFDRMAGLFSTSPQSLVDELLHGRRSV